MRLFSEEVKYTSSSSSLNVIQVKDFSEIFFGVLEVEINEKKYPVEEVGKHGGNPVVMLPLVVEGVEKEYPFVLIKGKQEIFFNENNTEIPVDDVILEESEEIDQERILVDIEKLKKDSIRKAQEELSRNVEILKEKTKREKAKKEKALKEYLETARENLVEEFQNISKRIKKEVFSSNDDKYSEIKETIDNKIAEISESLEESLKKSFQSSSKLIDKSIKQLVKDLYEKNINPRVDKELYDIAGQIVEKVSEIDKNLNNKLAKKADVSLVESVNKELDAIRDSNIELNNSLNKGVQKALSRVGNVDKKIVGISEKFDRKISQTEEEITEYFNEKLSLVKEQTLDITDEARVYFHDLIQESRDGLLSEIRKIKDEKPVEYILESKKGEPVVKDWSIIEKDWDKKIHDKFENYKTDLRKYVSVYASGGGTNATQYQDGGTMNGSLNVTGAYLSAGVNLLDIFGSGGLTNPVEVLEFDTAYSPTGSEPIGSMYWDSTDGTLELVQDGVKQQIGQETYIKVRNASGSTITNGTPVYFDGRQGNRPKIYPAQSDSHSTSVVTGIASQDIADGSDGFITTFGYVRQIKTNYSGAGDWGTTWNEGDNLYVSKTVAGQLTNVEPSVPHHSDLVGQVGIVGAAGIGSIFVSIRHHWTLEEASDINGTALTTTGQLPVWDNSLSAFDFNYNINNYLPLSGGSITGNVTMSGADSKFLIGQGTAELPSLTFNGDADTGMWSPAANTVAWSVGGSESMRINSSGNVGIGTTSPASQLHVSNVTQATARVGSGTRRIEFNSYSGDHNYLTAAGAPFHLGTTDSNQIIFRTNNIERGRFQNTTGRFGVGTTTPSAQIGVVSTTEQLRIGYDASNYYSTTVGSTGGVTFDANGSGAGFTFTDDVEFGANATIPEVIGNTSFAEDVEVLGALTAPNQSLVGGSSVLTQELEERSFPNNLWIPWFFNGVGRTGNRGGVSAGPIASTTVNSANLINDIIFLNMFATPWYPSGSGTPQRFSVPFSILFEADTNNQANADKYFVIGKAASTDYLLLPTIGDDCISIKWINNSQIQISIFYAGVVDQSDPIDIPTNLQNIEKYLIVWDGNTLYLYAAFWYGYNTMPKLSLIGSVTASGTLPLSMDHFSFYYAQHYIGPNTNSSVNITSMFMNRKAIHPI